MRAGSPGTTRAITKINIERPKITKIESDNRLRRKLLNFTDFTFLNEMITD